MSKDKEIEELRRQLEVADIDRAFTFASVRRGCIPRAPAGVVSVWVLALQDCDLYECM